MKTRTLETYLTSAINYTIETRNLNGRQHIVVPVVMIKEGVHHGSGGPIYHRSESLAQNVQAWNGIPVTIDHPQNGGQNVSAQNPQVLDQWSVGQIFNTRFEDGSLRAEAWLDVQRITALSPEALEHINSGQPLDVSVGVFSNSEEAQEGAEWNGETYDSIALDYHPDHLALLPGGQGACSWSDGCGIRNNNEGGKVDNLLATLKQVNQSGFAIVPISNEEGFQQISQLLQSALDAMDTNTKMFYLEEVFANDFVYRVRDADGGSNLFRRGYSVNAGKVELTDNSSEVRKEVSYVTMQMRRTKKPNINSNKKEDEQMSENSKTPCCEGKVDALIANASTRWKADDKEWLMVQEASVIEKLSPMELAPEVIQANSAEVLDTFKQTLKTIDDYTALMPEAMKVQVTAGVAAYAAKREALVKGIMENTEDAWTKETLDALADATLEGISKSIKKPVNYSGQAGGGDVVQTNAGGEILLPVLPE